MDLNGKYITKASIKLNSPGTGCNPSHEFGGNKD
jgi:hypothetical protein